MCNGGYLWIFLTQFKTSIFICSAKIFNKNCLTLLCWLFISYFFVKVRLIWLWSNKNKITFSCLLFSRHLECFHASSSGLHQIQISAFVFTFKGLQNSALPKKFCLTFYNYAMQVPYSSRNLSSFLPSRCSRMKLNSHSRPNFGMARSICVTGTDPWNGNHGHIR